MVTEEEEEEAEEGEEGGEIVVERWEVTLALYWDIT